MFQMQGEPFSLHPSFTSSMKPVESLILTVEGGPKTASFLKSLGLYPSL